MKLFVLMVVLTTLSVSNKVTADEGTARHVLVGFGSTLACSYFLKGLFRLEQDEKWKSSLICMGGLVAGSLLMEGAQAQERNKNIDAGDVGNNMAGGVAATALYLSLDF